MAGIYSIRTNLVYSSLRPILHIESYVKIHKIYLELGECRQNPYLLYDSASVKTNTNTSISDGFLFEKTCI